MAPQLHGKINIMAVLDSRIRRTRRNLTRALIELTLERGYENVTVREIAQRAGVGYATFFRHYQGKEALLADVVEAILEELLALIGPHDDPAVIGRRVFAHAEQHAALYRLLLNGPNDMLGRVYEVGIDSIISNQRPREAALVPVDMAANHIISSFLALIRWWLAHDMPYSPERMGEIYRELIFTPARELAFDVERA